MRKIPALCWLSGFLAPSIAWGGIGDIQVNGFLNVGAAWTNANFLPSGVEPIYASAIRKEPTFDRDTSVGIQLTKNFRESLSITTQFYAEATEVFEVEATWAFLKYEPTDHWQIRAGRVRAQPYMLSDYLDVGYAYPWVRPPEEVYSQSPMSNFMGADVQYKIPLWKRDLTVSAFYGSSKGHLNFFAMPNGALLDTIDLRLEHLGVFAASYGNETFSVRAGYEYMDVTLYPNSGEVIEGLNTFVNTMVGMNVLGPDYINYFSAHYADASFLGLGYQFNWKNVVSMGEWVKRETDTPIIANTIGWYLMGGYRVNQLLPHVTFARERLTDNYRRRFNSTVNAIALATFGQTLNSAAQAIVGSSPHFDGGAGAQTSVTLGLRWDVYEGVALKVEYQHVHPDWDSAGLFDVNPQQSVNVYSIALAAVM